MIIRTFRAEAAYETEEEADIHGIIYGQRIIDGKAGSDGGVKRMLNLFSSLNSRRYSRQGNYVDHCLPFMKPLQVQCAGTHRAADMIPVTVSSLESILYANARNVFAAIVYLSLLSGCGYMWQKAHGTDQLLQLSEGMSQYQVQAIMGKPNAATYYGDNIAIAVYKLYDSQKTADGLQSVFTDGWYGRGTFYPLSDPDKFLLSFLEGKFCNWEKTDSAVAIDFSVEEMAKRVRKTGRSGYCKAPTGAK